MSGFKLEIGQNVAIQISGEQGHIIGRAEYATTENQYYVHYKAADGRAVSNWFDESLLVTAY